jgi:hypothetical protein
MCKLCYTQKNGGSLICLCFVVAHIIHQSARCFQRLLDRPIRSLVLYGLSLRAKLKRFFSVSGKMIAVTVFVVTEHFVEC